MKRRTPSPEGAAPDRVRMALPMEDFDDLDALSARLSAEHGGVRGSDAETVQDVAAQTSYGAVLLDDLVHRQLMLALSVAASFLVPLLAIPVVNRLFPAVVAVRVLGLPLSWLALAVAMYPVLWLFGAYYTTAAQKNEDDFTDLIRK